MRLVKAGNVRDESDVSRECEFDEISYEYDIEDDEEDHELDHESAVRSFLLALFFGKVPIQADVFARKRTEGRLEV